MKICPKCHATFDDEVQFCTVCGEAMAEPQEAQPQEAQPQEAQPIPPTYQPPQGYQEQKEEQAVSTGKWILYQLIPIIPVVGWIVYVVMLFVWAFGNSAQNNTFRNWARSNLILVGISFVLTVLVIVAGVAFSMSFLSTMGTVGMW